MSRRVLRPASTAWSSDPHRRREVLDRAPAALPGVALGDLLAWFLTLGLIGLAAWASLG